MQRRNIVARPLRRPSRRTGQPHHHRQRPCVGVHRLQCRRCASNWASDSVGSSQAHPPLLPLPVYCNSSQADQLPGLILQRSMSQRGRKGEKETEDFFPTWWGFFPPFLWISGRNGVKRVWVFESESESSLVQPHQWMFKAPSSSQDFSAQQQLIHFIITTVFCFSWTGRPLIN